MWHSEVRCFRLVFIVACGGCRVIDCVESVEYVVKGTSSMVSLRYVVSSRLQVTRSSCP